MDKLHIVLILIALAVIGYVIYVNFGKKKEEAVQETKKTGKAPLIDIMPTPPLEDQEEVVQVYADSLEDLATYYIDPEIEFGVSQEEFERLVQREMEKREYKVKKLDRSKYMNEDKAKRLNDLSRNQMEDLTQRQMKKKKMVTETIYEEKDYLSYRDKMNEERGQGIATRHSMGTLEKQNLDRPEGLAY